MKSLNEAPRDLQPALNNNELFIQMDIINILAPLTLLMVFVAILGYIWAVHSGQFDDCDTPAVRALFDGEKLRIDRFTGTKSQHKSEEKKEDDGRTI